MTHSSPADPSLAVQHTAESRGGQIALSLLSLAAYAGGVWWLVDAYPHGIKAQKPLLITGGLHPLVVHMPIGILFAALGLEMLSGKSRRFATAVNWLLWMSFLSGVVSVGLGYLLGLGQEMTSTLNWHMWLGIAVPALACLTLFFKLIHDTRPIMSKLFYRAPFFTSVAALAAAGHFGGAMTHAGATEKFLGLFLPPAAAVVAGGVEDRTVYDAVIAPMMTAHCTGCHGEEKKRGKLQMHTLAALLMAGESGNPSIVPGKSADSESIKRIALPLDDDEHMPPSKKPQLNADQVEVLKWWIDSGAKGDVKIKDSGLTEPLKTKVLALANAEPAAAPAAPAPAAVPAPAALAPAAAAAPAPAAPAAAVPAPAAITPAVPAPAAPPTPPAPAAPAAKKPAGPDPAIAALEKELGISLIPVAQNDSGLIFNCVNVADKFGDAELAKFAPVAARMVELNLSRSKVTDAGLAILPTMKGLKKLHLQNTAVTDAAADHLSTATELEYLNLFGTKITDAMVPKLASLTKLKKLYLWQTAVTKPAAEALFAKLPDAVINLGWDNEVKKAAPIAAAVVPATPATDPHAAAPKTPEAAPATPPATALDPEKSVFVGVIAPIFEAKCVSCHGAEKQKGKLAMHTLEALLKGGDSGEPVYLAGKSAESLMMKRIALPMDDDEHMPPAKKTQLTEKEIKVLAWWINAGAKTDVKIKDAAIPADLQ